MLEMRGDPAAARTDLSKAQQRAIARQLRTSQDRIKGRIDGLGGKVLATYQAAYNGVKVRISQAAVAELAELPGVVAVRSVRTFQPDNARGVPYIGAPAAWQDLGLTGAGVRIAVIDTGIDYTHAGLGGSGSVAAYDGNDPEVIEPGTFPTAKVVGGYDFAGNDYDATGDLGSTTPSPDPDPLDCNGHGSHVVGHGRRQRRAGRRHAPTAGRTTRPPTATRSRSARASRPRPSCSPSRSSAATARPT